ncbi:MAG: cell division protein FtsK, partial [Sulfurimonas sp.]|nr:cell division protein FtsK [Sulfurimonas sp.]
MNKITVKDALYKRAKKLVLDDNNASISYVQRKLEISYNRARIIVELLEKKDAISTPDKYGIRR